MPCERHGRGVPLSGLRGAIGRFQLRAVIGHGGYAVVYLAYDPDLGQELALKVIETDPHEPEVVAAEQRGAVIQQQLSAKVPQIARVFDTGTEGRRFWIAMEYVRGQDLSEILRRGTLAEPRAVAIAVQLCRVVEACARVPLAGGGHQDQVVHGDLKPENLRIDEHDQVRLLDFGVAKSVSQSRKVATQHYGSIPYVDPERLAGNRVDLRSDLWSIGVVLFQMVSGALPFPGDSVEEIKERILSGAPASDPPSDCSAGLRRILRRCLERDPARRYPDVAALRTALEALDPSRDVRFLTRTTGRAAPGADPFATGATAAAESSAARHPDPSPSPAATVAGMTRTPDPAATTKGGRAAGGWWRRLPWWVRRASARAELAGLAQSLRRWRHEVPAWAVRFHALRVDLLGQIAKLEPFWRWRIESAELDRLRLRCARLGELVSPLLALHEDVEALTSGRAAALLRAAERSGDPILEAWLRTRCQEWTRRLAAGLERCGSDAELVACERQLAAATAEIDRLAGLAAALSDGAHVLAVLGSDARAAPLAAELERIRRQVREPGGLAEGKIDPLRDLLRPFAELVREFADPRGELDRLAGWVAGLERWDRTLPPSPGLPDGAAAGATPGQLTARLQGLAADWNPAGAAALARDAAALQAALTARSEAWRDAARIRLAAHLAELEAIGKPQPELVREVARLAQEPCDSVEASRAVQEHRRRLEEEIHSRAGGSEEALARRLEGRLDALRGRLAALRAGGLSAAGRQRAAQWQAEAAAVAAVGPAAGAAALLDALQTCAGLDAGLGLLEQKAARELADLASDERDLAERALDLQHFAIRLNTAAVYPVLTGNGAGDSPRLAVPPAPPRPPGASPRPAAPPAPPGPPIDSSVLTGSGAGDSPRLAVPPALPAPPGSPADLEDGRRRLDARAAALASLWPPLAAVGRSRLAELRAGALQLAEALRAAGHEQTPVSCPEWPADGPPSTALAALAAAEDLVDRLGRAVEDAMAAAEERRRRLAVVWQQRERSTLGAQQAAALEPLLSDGGQGPWRPESTPTERLTSLAAALAAWDGLMAGLEEDEQAVHRRQEVLLGRLRDRQRQPESYCPDLAARARALAAGVPARPPRLRAAVEQLDLAERLTGLAERHAARLAAAELEQAVGVLHAGSGSPESAEAADLLRSLAAYAPDQEPPAGLRQRVVEAAQRAARRRESGR